MSAIALVDGLRVTTMSLLLVAVAASVVLAKPAAAGGPSLSIGVVEDAVKQPTVVATKAKLKLVRQAGFDTVNVTEAWTNGETAPPAHDVAMLRNVFSAARSLGMHVIVRVFPSGSSQTPLTAGADDRFAAFTVALARAVGAREVIVGNEPNLNRFWLPQFGPDGSDAAAPASLNLLAPTYDALKAFDPRIVVDGVAVSAHGSDRPGGVRPTHSPTVFTEDLGHAYRASGRARPVMDAFDIHPYEENSSVSPTVSHPDSTTIAIADYGKLVPLLGQAFDGTAQAGSTLPIVYGEFGVESLVPPAKAAVYTGTEPATTKPVDEITQGNYYGEAIARAFCQPNVRTLLLLHAFDEPSLAGWQSGVYYADGTPKKSLPIVRQAIHEARRGTVTHCPGLALTPRALRVVWSSGALTAGGPLSFRLACSIDCTYQAQLEHVPSGSVVVSRRGRLASPTLTRIRLLRAAKAGRYRLRLTLLAPVNPGPPRVLVGPLFDVRRAPPVTRRPAEGTLASAPR